MSLTIYTAIFGDRDILHEPESDFGCRWVCFTDQPFESQVWEIRKPQRRFIDPRREARMYKCLSHLVLPNASRSIWLDGRVLPTMSPLAIANSFRADLTTFRHGDRESVREEAAECCRLGLCDPDIAELQLRRYEAAGFSVAERGGVLAETPVVIRTHSSNGCRRFNELWWAEISAGSVRDQLSFDYAAWAAGIGYCIFPGTVRTCPLFKLFPHAN